MSTADGVYRQSDTDKQVPGKKVIAIAIDADKGSRHALKWAADHVVCKGDVFILVHVRVRRPAGSQLPNSTVEQDVAATNTEQINDRTKELMLPFQCFCSRRGLQYTEVILDDADVPKAVVSFIVENFVDTLVIGASSSMRTMKKDTPTIVSKSVPNFCSVYTINKGKISAIRPATCPGRNPARAPRL